MTYQEVQLMNDEQLRSLLSKLRGYPPSSKNHRVCMSGGSPVSIPNYPRCLESCHHAWMMLDMGQMKKFSKNLRLVIAKGEETNFTEFDQLYTENATSRERTIALILTLQ
jgi:hypothetical protein